MAFYSPVGPIRIDAHINAGISVQGPQFWPFVRHLSPSATKKYGSFVGAYELVPTAGAPGDGRPANVPVFGALLTGGQTGRETRRIDSSYCPQFTATEIQAAQAALAQRRAVIEARLLGNNGRVATA